MSSTRRRKKMNQREALQDNQNERTDSIASMEKPMSPIAAFFGTIWFFGLSITACIVTETYYEFAIAFGVHYFVFILYAFPNKSDKFYDFTGMIAFVSVDIFSFVYRKQSLNHIRNVILSLMALCWTLRLGLFLFWRILKHNGSDSRMDALRNGFFSFLMVWTLSGQWVFFCMMPIFIVNKNDYDSNIYALDIIGWAVFFIGWVIEIVADAQKTDFKSNPKNKGKFINIGLWKLSRHPNYFGDIMVWIGITISSCSVIQNNTDWLVFLSPFWTFMLLVFMSGIPGSEKMFKSKYKSVEGFQEYLDNTPVLIPFCFCWK